MNGPRRVVESARARLCINSNNVYSIHHLIKPVTGDRVFMLKSIRDHLKFEVGVAFETGQYMVVTEERAMNVARVKKCDINAGKTQELG
jgi:hypothetical protein